jgi:mannose-6-phosphate isomerase-like protein (cupin superfamily)
MNERSSAMGYVLHAGQGIPNGGPDLKASVASTGGALTLIESRTTGGAPMHVHSREDECFYVLEGTIVVHCGEDEYEAGPGSFVFLPRGVPHDWDVRGEVATVLIVGVPGGLEGFLSEFHEALDQEARRHVAEKYGIEFI